MDFRMVLRKPRFGVIMITLLVLATALSGCSGKSKNSANAGDALPSTAPSAAHDENTGGLEGSILGDDALPIASAEVGLLGSNFPTQRTGGDGRYAFGNIPPGRYTLQAQRIGFSTAAEFVDIKAGETKSLDLILHSQAIPGVDYRVPLQPIPGQFFCGFGADVQGVGGASGTCKVVYAIVSERDDPIDEAWNDATGGDQSVFELATVIKDNKVLANDQAASVVFEVTWQSSTAASDFFSLDVFQTGDNLLQPDGNGSEPATYTSGVGGPGMKVVATPGVKGPYEKPINNQVAMPLDADGFSFWVFPFAKSQPVVLPLQQTFQVWITIFYNEPAPADFTILQS